ncbi:hypothetical protein GN244_ATG08504 [Phytophthora infestans]|uniref:Uncharacterized protein n=1 Tax=Phytophthora infestans TaxID=4787 RepID=A0A833T917_PHYIN|nr:hypothetical protein GN244_ATG08504 [Phytophthora infestans]KAF4132362.1 hypothetical protein GN958_ATG18479 [Phytophthora infestans]
MAEFGGNIIDDDTLLKLARPQKNQRLGGRHLTSLVFLLQSQLAAHTNQSIVVCFKANGDQHTLLQTIANESSRYAAQTVMTCARGIRERQAGNKPRSKRDKDVKALKEVRQRLRSMKPFEPN